MSMLAAIKTAQLTARKARDTNATSSLTTLIGEATAIGKNDGDRDTTDAEVTATVKKFIKNIDDTLRVLPNGGHADRIRLLIDEKELYQTFLPTQLTTDQLESVVVGLIQSTNATGIRDMGVVMKALKDGYDGQYDGSVASQLIKKLLQPK